MDFFSISSLFKKQVSVLNYPNELHKLHRDFPLAPVRYNVTYKDLSPLNKVLYQKMKNNDLYNTFSEQKLIPTFHKRKKYILHIKCLQFYLSKGLVLDKVHRIVSFKQEPFLKEYIVTLTKLRSICAKKNLTFFCQCIQTSCKLNIWQIL